jgi:cullin 3
VQAGIDLSVQVCTASHWPLNSEPSPCVLPASLADAAAAFERYYHARHTGRRLSWRPELGTVDVRTRFSARSHELTVSTHAMAVLALFSDTDELDYANIEAGTQIPGPELKRALQSLACGRFRVLSKTPKGREVAETDVFKFNSSFTSPLARVRIPALAVGRAESNAERVETDRKTEAERARVTEACIVRVLKDRKTMMHTDLVQEVIRQLAPRFQPTPTIVKLAVERLIEVRGGF